VHALKSGDREDRELWEILDRFDRAKAELVLRISVARVGLVGNLQDGFRVTFDVLTETNDKAKQVLGINLALMDRLRDRALQQTDGMIRLDASDAEELGLRGARATAHRTASRGSNCYFIPFFWSPRCLECRRSFYKVRSRPESMDGPHSTRRLPFLVQKNGVTSHFRPNTLLVVALRQCPAWGGAAAGELDRILNIDEGKSILIQESCRVRSTSRTKEEAVRRVAR